MPRPLTLQYLLSLLGPNNMQHPEKISVSDVFPSTLLTPGQLKPASLRAWGDGYRF